MSRTLPAQQVLVARVLDWGTVEERLSRYPAIKEAFPLDMLRQASGSPPYYAHYLAWRLGTWHKESLFQRLDELLSTASQLPNWHGEESLRSSAEYADFWALHWQLQVVEYLVSSGFQVSWLANGGPDLCATRDGRKLHVECYQYRKAFHLRLFLQELVSHLGDDLVVHQPICRPLTLPRDGGRCDFFDRALQPIVDEVQLLDFRARARTQWPVVVSRPVEDVTIYLRGPNIGHFDPSALADSIGSPMDYLDVALRESLGWGSISAV